MTTQPNHSILHETMALLSQQSPETDLSQMQATSAPTPAQPAVPTHGGSPTLAALAPTRLRSLSELGVVQLTHRSEVLLPGDVPGHLDEPGSQPDHAVRRAVPESGRVVGAAPGAEAAVEKYIAQQESKKAINRFILKTRRYSSDIKTELIYTGTRFVDGHALALLRRGDVVEVLPVDSNTARKLASLRPSAAVTVHGNVIDSSPRHPTGKTSIPTKGRSR
jgi:hypothetical protein